MNKKLMTVMLHVLAAAVCGVSARQEPTLSSADQFRAFIQRHEEIEKSRSLEEAVGYYAERVEYFDHGRVSRDLYSKTSRITSPAGLQKT